MTTRLIHCVLGLSLIVAGSLLPYLASAPLPRTQGLQAPPMSGLVLFEVVAVTGGIGFLLLCASRFRYRRLDQAARFGEISSPRPEPDLSRSQACALVSAITALALGLRVYGLNSGLWLDEITPRLLFGEGSALQVWLSYQSSSNHLINTLLVNAAVWVFGEREWVIRLPACLFGTATVPVCYLLARVALPRWAGACAALLLATSYHHVFFSQNARGYAAYVLFSVASSLFLIRALGSDAPRDWIGYIATTFLNFASLPIAAVVFAAQLVASAAACAAVWFRSGNAGRLMGRLAGVFTGCGYLALLMYAPVLPEMYVYLPAIYSEADVGFSLFSIAFIREVVRGLSAGLGPVAVACAGIGGLAVSAIGVREMLRRNWLALALLALPNLFLVALAAFLGYLVSPRFFLFGLIPAAIVIVAGVSGIVRWPQPSAYPALSLAAKVALPVLLSAVSLYSLKSYYATPKQDFRGAIEFIRQVIGEENTAVFGEENTAVIGEENTAVIGEENTALVREEGIVIVADQMRGGFRYYAPRLGLKPEQYVNVHDGAELDDVLRKHRGQRVLLATTLWRILRIRSPSLAARIERDWQVSRVFPGTVGGGEITVWRLRDGDRISDP